MTNARRRAGFAQKTKPRRFVTEISLADDFQCHGASQIDVERFVSDTHRTATQLDRFPVFVRSPVHSARIDAMRRLRCRLRTALFQKVTSPDSSLFTQRFTQHANRTELFSRRELRPANQTSACVLHVHRPNRPSVAIRASQSAWISSSTSPESLTVRATSSRKTEAYRLRRRKISFLTDPTRTRSVSATCS